MIYDPLSMLVWILSSELNYAAEYQGTMKMMICSKMPFQKKRRRA
jgi:hypothetical protein